MCLARKRYDILNEEKAMIQNYQKHRKGISGEMDSFKKTASTLCRFYCIFAHGLCSTNQRLEMKWLARKIHFEDHGLRKRNRFLSFRQMIVVMCYALHAKILGHEFSFGELKRNQSILGTYGIHLFQRGKYLRLYPRLLNSKRSVALRGMRFS